jgi:hypothetical protein
MRDIRMLIAALLVPTLILVTAVTVGWLLLSWRAVEQARQAHPGRRARKG